MTAELCTFLFCKGKPTIRVSHEIKGRIPEAVGKPADRLLPEKVNRHWERIAFNIEVPSIRENVCGNDLSLSIGGARALNYENLYGRKTDERLKSSLALRIMAVLTYVFPQMATRMISGSELLESFIYQSNFRSNN